MLPKKYEKYTNYNGYIVGNKKFAHAIEEIRLLKVITKMCEKYKSPYIRFMWVADAPTAVCVLYSDVKKNEHVTKIVLFDDVEKLIMEDEK